MITDRPAIPVYDICTLDHQGQVHEEIIAERFSDYLEVHPNLHSPHRHAFYHMVLFTSGEGYHSIDFEQFPVRAGSMYFMRPGQVHSWNFTTEPDGYIINFSETLCNPMSGNRDYSERFPFFRGLAADSVLQLTAATYTEACRLMQQLNCEVRRKDSLSKDMLCSLLHTLLITIARDQEDTGAGQEPQLQGQLILQQFRRLLEQQYTGHRLPKDYAAMLYITPNHLNAVCRHLLGKPAGAVIRDRVLLEAKRLLVNADLTIAEIAYTLNFTDNSYFTKFFKKYTAVTPEAFRRSAIKP